MIDETDYPGIVPNVAAIATDDLRRSVAIIEAQLEPADAKHIKDCVTAIFIANGTKLVGEEAALIVELWHEANGDLPADLWSEGARGVMRSHIFGQPKPADLRKHVEAAFDQRMRRRHRVRYLLKLKDQEPVKPPFRPEPEDVRQRALRDSLRKVGRFDRSAGAEVRLATLEQRPPELFDDERRALEQPAAPPPKPDPVHRESDWMKAHRLIAVARHHQGKPYAARLIAEARALAPELVEAMTEPRGL